MVIKQNIHPNITTIVDESRLLPVKINNRKGENAKSVQAKYHQKVRICQVKWLSKIEPCTSVRFT